MMDNPYSNFHEVVRDLQSLIADIEIIRQKIVEQSGISYFSQDARQVALYQVKVYTLV